MCIRSHRLGTCKPKPLPIPPIFPKPRKPSPVRLIPWCSPEVARPSCVTAGPTQSAHSDIALRASFDHLAHEFDAVDPHGAMDAFRTCLYDGACAVSCSTGFSLDLHGFNECIPGILKSRREHEIPIDPPLDANIQVQISTSLLINCLTLTCPQCLPSPET